MTYCFLWQKWIPGISPGGKCGRCVGMTTLPPSCADSLEILGVSNSLSPKGLSRSVMGLRYSSCKTQCLSRIGNTFVSGNSEQIIIHFEKQSWPHSTIINRVKCQPSRNACAMALGTQGLQTLHNSKSHSWPQGPHNRVISLIEKKVYSFCIKWFCKEQMHHTLSWWTKKWGGGGRARQQLTIVRANRVTRPHAVIARRRLKNWKLDKFS
jgi:hypothetical protein